MSLTRAYVVSRYPDILVGPGAAAEIDPGDAERHLRDAENVMAWVEQQLSTASNGGRLKVPRLLP